MKKLSITLLLTLILATSVVLTACTSATEPSTAIRWTDESITYNITMQPETIPDAVEYDSNEFVSVTDLASYAYTDQITPTDITGTFTTTLELQDSNWLFTTDMSVYESYDITDDTVSDFVDSLTTEQYDALVSAKDTDTVTLYSSTVTTVLFTNSSAQTPINSTKVVSGYYLGALVQTVYSTDIECNYEDNVATVTGTVNGEAVETSTSVTSSTIDAAQVLLYARSLDQSETFETSATLELFAPETATYVSAIINLTTDYCLLLDLDDNDEELEYASVNCLDLLVDSEYYAYRIFTNPSDTMTSAASASGLNKYTPVMFQSGMYVFHLDSYVDISDDLAYSAS